MNQVDIQDQVRLSVAKSFELCLSGIRYRLFRSLVTVSIVTLAVAFLTTMLSQSLIGRNVGQAVAAEAGPQNEYLGWLHRLGKPLTEDELVETLAAAPPPRDRVAELVNWGKLSGAELALLQSTAQAEKRYLDYLSALSEAGRTLLIGSAGVNSGVFERLMNARVLAEFEKNVKVMDAPLPGGITAFQQFLQQWSLSRPLQHRVLTGQADAVARVQQLLQGQNLTQWLAQADEAQFAWLESLGYVPGGDAGNLREHARLELLAARMSTLRNLPGLRLELASWAGVVASAVSEQTLYEQAATLRGAQRILDSARREATVELSAEEMVQVSQARLRQARLTAVQAKLPPDATHSLLGFPPRTLWLIVVSFGVCAVGIANAVLMSVTERFREIATMKCLGAMDGFILVLFVLESALQGIAGGAVGAVVGLMLGLLRSWISFGSFAFAQLPWSGLLGCAGVSLLAGVALAAVAAVYPARIASKLAPMEAMRVE